MAYMNMQIYSWRHSKESKRIDQGFSLHFLSDHCAMSQDVLLLLEADLLTQRIPENGLSVLTVRLLKACWRVTRPGRRCLKCTAYRFPSLGKWWWQHLMPTTRACLC